MALSGLFALEINLRIIALNNIPAKFLMAALHHSLHYTTLSLNDPVGSPRPGLRREAGGNCDDHPPRRPPNGPFPGWFSHCVEPISARADMSEGDATYFMLGFAAGVALLWVVTETIWMRL